MIAQATRLSAHYGKSVVVFAPFRTPGHNAADWAELARELLGWSPEVSLRDGLALTIEQSGVELLVGGGSA